jgi:hypothetical protein
MSSICPPHNDIDILLQVKRLLEELPEKEQKPEYTTVVKLVNDYITKRCNHYVVTDTIDIDPDRSKTIYYCEYCYTTFSGPR